MFVSTFFMKLRATGYAYGLILRVKTKQRILTKENLLNQSHVGWNRTIPTVATIPLPYAYLLINVNIFWKGNYYMSYRVPYIRPILLSSF